MIKLVAIDVDGTLLNSTNKISEKNKESIKTAINQGAVLALASGRPLFGLFDIFEQLEINADKHYLIPYNGAIIAKASDYTKIFERTLEFDLAKSILKHLEQFPLTIVLSRNQEIIVEDANGYMINEETIANQMELIVVDNLAEFLDYRPNKILISGDPSIIDQNIDAIQAPFLDVVDFVKSAPFYLEIIVKDTNKGTSLAHLAQLLNIKQDEVMAIGDNYNDLSMIEYAGLGVAMGQADAYIQSKAKFVSLTNDEDGVAFAINKFLL